MAIKPLIAILTSFVFFQSMQLAMAADESDVPKGTMESRKNSIYMPELILKNNDQNYCVFNVSVSGNAHQRIARFRRFVDKSYEQTRHWSQKFAIAGVDYEAFKYFYLIKFISCANLAEMNGYRMDGMNARVAPGPSPLVVDEATVRQTGTGLSGFIHYRHALNVRRCLSVIETPTAESTSKLYDKLGRAWIKYRPPVADLEFGDNVLYVLLSRRCSHKDRVLGHILNLSGVSSGAVQIITNVSAKNALDYEASQGLALQTP